ncbi:hypothetical protein [Agarivorans sp.]|uniref:hypothetical protein n=1 Tax=Agarivorans sp. TaxID=1872412 RepID=UPI003D07A88C
MNKPTWHKALTWVLIVSVLWLAAIWAEHQLERLDPGHDDQHCQLCLQLHKLTSAVASSAGLMVPLVLFVLLVLSASAYQYQVPARAQARAPPAYN